MEALIRAMGPTLTPNELACQLALAVITGMLIGLQRERSRSSFGIRTFPLITIFGLLCGTLSNTLGYWFVPVGLICMTMIGVSTCTLLALFGKKGLITTSSSVSHTIASSPDTSFSVEAAKIRSAPVSESIIPATINTETSIDIEVEKDATPALIVAPIQTSTAIVPQGLAPPSAEAELPTDTPEDNGFRDFGTTTLMTLLVMYCVGAMLANPSWNFLALEITGITAIILQFKFELHRIARTLGDSDMKAIMQFVIFTFIILPILPNKSIGPFSLFNPYETWLMVVLIVGVNLWGYICYKFFSKHAGVYLSGILGGLISSMATTLSYSRMVAKKEASPNLAASVIAMASAVMLLRLLFLVGIVSEPLLLESLLPVGLFFALSAFPLLIYAKSIHNENQAIVHHTNPTHWRSAVLFGLLYAGVAALMKLASLEIGTEGVYFVAAVSGFTETTSPVLSTARLSLTSPEVLMNGWQIIILCSLTNMVTKTALAFSLGGRNVGLQLLRLVIIPIIGGIALFFIF